MKKPTKILIAAGALVLLGCIAFVCIMSAALDWDFSKLSMNKYETNITEIGEAFRNIAITSETADIRFALSDDGKCRVECREEEKARHSVTVENDTLIVSVNNRKSWYDYIGFHFGSQKITVYLPKTVYAALSIRENTGNIEIPGNFAFTGADISISTGDVGFFATARETVRIRTSTGNINVENTSGGSLDLSVTTGMITVAGVTCTGDITVGVSTGKSYLNDVACRNVISGGTTGDISLDHVIAAEKLSVERSTGDVKLAGCDAAEIRIKTSAGNVTGSLLTDKVFITDTKTGSVDVPKTTTGGRCEISTGTGDIRIETE